MHRARHADRAEKQRDEADEAHERKHILQRVAELALAFLDRLEAQPLVLEFITEGLRDQLGVGQRRQFKMHAVPREAVDLEQLRSLQRGHRNVDARLQQRDRRRFAGDFFQRADDLERGPCRSSPRRRSARRTARAACPRRRRCLPAASFRIAPAGSVTSSP